jgi:hypothetical protein
VFVVVDIPTAIIYIQYLLLLAVIAVILIESSVH